MLLDDSTHDIGSLAQVFRSRTDIDVELAANLVVVDFRRGLNLLDIGHHIETGRLRNALGVERDCL